MPDNHEIDEILKELRKKDTSSDKKESSNHSFNISENKDNNYNNFDIITDSFNKKADDFLTVASDDTKMEKRDKNKKMKNKNKRIKPVVIVIIAVLVVAIAGTCAYLIWAKNKNAEPEPTTESTTASTTAPVKVINPLTGEDNYNKNAIGKRSVACVVENAYAARPQWGIDSENNAPDIIIEGEVEGGETRMLWMYADYTSLPDQIGPLRSARPPFIRFSQLFDSIFIHWGQSTSKDNYVGADSVFKTEDVDHINQMAYNDKFNIFGRDSSRGVSSEHTGVLYGKNLADAIADTGFRTDVSESKCSSFSFNEEDSAVGQTVCNSIGVKFSANTKTRDWTYSADDKMYHCTDYLTDVERKNVLVLFDTTTYIVKSNYKGSGNSETYCDYALAGGSGKLASMGTVTDITWSVNSGIIKVTDTNGKDVNLNPGKTWIGWASENKGGTAEVL